MLQVRRWLAVKLAVDLVEMSFLDGRCGLQKGRVRRPQQCKIVLCVHSMREHTDVIETGNEVSYDICRNVDIRVSWCKQR